MTRLGARAGVAAGRGLERGPRGHEQDRHVRVEPPDGAEQLDPLLARGLVAAEVHVLHDHPHVRGGEPSQEQKRFCAAERRGRLCVVASPDGRRGSLRLHQDTLMCSALLGPGQHVVHELAQGRTAWLHLVQGEVVLGDVVLTTGDGIGVTAERAVSLTVRAEAEILLFDLGPRGAKGEPPKPA